MNSTKDHKPAQIKRLNYRQLTAARAVSMGYKDNEVAQLSRVRRETVSRWRNQNLAFRLEVQRQQEMHAAILQQQSLGLTQRAYEVLAEVMDWHDGVNSTKVAIEIFRRLWPTNIGRPTEEE